jgi:hypothetical protein
MKNLIKIISVLIFTLFATSSCSNYCMNKANCNKEKNHCEHCGKESCDKTCKENCKLCNKDKLDEKNKKYPKNKYNKNQKVEEVKQGTKKE